MSEEVLSSENPYQLEKQAKQPFLLHELNELTEWHLNGCLPYEQMLEKTGSHKTASQLADIPYLPVPLFKMLKLFSLPEEEHFKTLTSSGTSGQEVSKIYLDRSTAQHQSKALNTIVRSFLGNKRLPMLIIDTNILKDRTQFSARSAGTIGFSQFGRDHVYLLNEKMEVDWELVEPFLQKYEGQPILLFGFTFIIWQYFYTLFNKIGRKLDLSGSILIHGGGWKKLQDESVDNETFKNSLSKQFNIQKVHNYYGMVEQVGSIFMECEHGYFHVPDFTDVIVRDMNSLKPAQVGETGVIQVLSTLPRSYPGHSLLTEDLGTVWGEDTCKCGRKGKMFTVQGRIPKVEIRGCSDTVS